MLEDKSPGVAEGETLFLQNCAFCHDAGVPKAPARASLHAMDPQHIYKVLTEGVMRPQAGRLSDEQRRTVAEFLTGKTLAQSQTRAETDTETDTETETETETAAAAGKTLCPAGRADWFDYSKAPSTDDPRNTAFGAAARTGLPLHDVTRLELKWVFAYPKAVRARSTPSLAGGALYVGSQEGTVYALDAASGCVRWTFAAEEEVRTAVVVAPWQGTTARAGSAAPAAYFGDLIGNVYAVDSVRGTLLWKTKVDAHPSARITASPTYYAGKGSTGKSGGRLYVPVSSEEVISASDPHYSCCSFRGAVVALDATNGAVIWKTYTIPNPPTEQKKNSLGVAQLGPSGAAVWNPPTVDAQRRALYFGTGQNYSSPADKSSDSIFAVSLDDGHVLWQTQPVAGDAWNVSCFPSAGRENCPAEDGPDLDFGSAPMLLRASGKPGPKAGIEAGGKSGDKAGDTAGYRDIIVAGRKSGDVYGLDPDDHGRIVWQRKLGRGSTEGGVHFGMAADGSKAFIPIYDQDFAEAYMPLSEATISKYFPGPAKPGIYAIDAFTGAAIWSAPLARDCKAPSFCQGYSAAIAAIPQVLFAAGNDGRVRAFDSASGKVLWVYDTRRDFKAIDGEAAHGGSIDGRPGPIVYNGMVYVNSGYDGLKSNAPGNVLLAFGVGH